MSERTEYAPGEFCWVDLTTGDTEAAAQFYGELFGWESESAGPFEQTGGYGFFLRHGKQVAGYGPVQNPEQPPAWGSYVKVEDADATCEKAKAAGGSVVFGPIDLPAEAGRMAVVADTGGAALCLMQQNQHGGAQLVNEAGSWTWNQLVTNDLDGARSFYGSVFGWELTRSQNAPPGIPVFLWQVEGQRWPEGLAGAMLMEGIMPRDTPPHWGVYFAVDDADRATTTVRRRGGSVVTEPQEIPVGRLAGLTDPQGAAFAIIESHYPEPR